MKNGWNIMKNVGRIKLASHHDFCSDSLLWPGLQKTKSWCKWLYGTVPPKNIVQVGI
jgi:hypothetical protein